MKLCLILSLFYSIVCTSQQDSISENFLNKGVKAYSLGEYQQALVLFNKSIDNSKKTKNNKILGNAYNNLANTYTRIGKSEQALSIYFSCVDVFSELKDTLNIAKTYKNIGVLYSEQKDFSMALQYYEHALTIASQKKYETLIADCLNNKGVIYEQQEKYKEALTVYTNALKIYEAEANDSHISLTLNNLAIVYKYLGDYQKSILYYQRAIALSIKLEDKFMIAANQNNLGNVYILTGKYSKSLELCQLAYNNARLINAQEIIVESLDGIATAHEKLNQYTDAIKYRKLYESEKDNYQNSERTTLLADMQIKYEAKKKEAEIEFLQRERMIKNLEIKEQDFQINKRNYLIGFFLLLLFALFFIAYTWKSKQKLKNQLVYDRLVWETEEHERRRLAKDIHDDLGSGLSKINFLSELIYNKTEHLPEVKINSVAVMDTAKSMIGNMRDLIWALNPDNATIANLIARMREYTSDFLEDHPIELHYSIPKELSQTQITKETYRELFMTVKEILNNIYKHSKASEVFFTVILSENDLSISIRDNGVGIEIDTIKKGNGLNNMKDRLEAIGGLCSINSNLRGTEILIEISISKILKA